MSENDRWLKAIVVMITLVCVGFGFACAPTHPSDGVVNDLCRSV